MGHKFHSSVSVQTDKKLIEYIDAEHHFGITLYQKFYHFKFEESDRKVRNRLAYLSKLKQENPQRYQETVALVTKGELPSTPKKQNNMFSSTAATSLASPGQRATWETMKIDEIVKKHNGKLFWY